MLKLYLVIPCYNENAVIDETTKRLNEKLNGLIRSKAVSPASRVVYIDDGSTDGTWEKIESISATNGLFEGVKLSRNYGHQNALLAGLHYAADHADAVISMDADLQDDIDAIDKMIAEYQKGCEVVYGVRSKRKKDSFFKRFTAQGFYKLLRFMGVEIVFNHADYRLLSNRAVKELLGFKEVNLFLRGIVPMLGFKSAKVYYERGERFAGESKYPLKKMLFFALQGITSLSVKPIRLITIMGLLCFLVSLVLLIVFIAQYFMGITVSGWASMITSIWGLGGLQLLGIGIIGEYIGKIYLETKERPRFIIEKTTSETTEASMCKSVDKSSVDQSEDSQLF